MSSIGSCRAVGVPGQDLATLYSVCNNCGYHILSTVCYTYVCTYKVAITRVISNHMQVNVIKQG